VKSRVVTVTGKRGTLTKSFKHMSIELTKVSPKILRIDMWFTNRKQAAYMKTVKGHIQNMFKGVTNGYLYKMKAVYAHFPINIATSEENTVVDIRNFLGEKYTRTVRMRPGVKCSPTGTKDEIKVEGNNLELVSQSGEWVAVAQRMCILSGLDLEACTNPVGLRGSTERGLP
jgi:large subunit ribosomal protein L9e